MDNLLTVCFEAHHASHNHHRHYAVTVGRDLLGHWTVAIRYGRTGQAGQERHYAAAEPEAIRAIVRERLLRRLSAPNRIGCAYLLAAYNAAPSFDAAAWLPGDVMARFFDPAVWIGVRCGIGPGMNQSLPNPSEVSRQRHEPAQRAIGMDAGE